MSLLASARRPAAPLSLASRGSEARRRHRRGLADTRLFCGTNGCPTRLQLDAGGGVAVCPICGFRRRLA